MKTFIQAHTLMKRRSKVRVLEIRFGISHSKDFSSTNLLNFKDRTMIPIQVIDKPYTLEMA